MSHDDEERESRGGLTPYQIDEDTVRVNNPDPDEPTKSYDARKRKD